MNDNQLTQKQKFVTGRVDTGLDCIQIQIVHGRGTLEFDPNGILVAAITESLELGEPIGPSDLSAEPAYLYRTQEVQLLLTKGELYRLIRHCLHPSEYRKLYALAGDFFEIHGDFYDAATGKPIQPV